MKTDLSKILSVTGQSGLYRYIAHARGIYGTVVEIKDKSVLVEVDKDVKIRVDKNAVQGDFSESEAASK